MIDSLRGLMVRLRALVRRDAAERELSDELRFHLEMQIAQYRRLGYGDDEARRRALVAFGGVERTKEDHRDVRGRWLEELGADARYAARTLRRAPVLTGAAILTLALGVGANVTIFSAVNAVVIRPLPVRDPARLVMLWEKNPEKGWYQQVIAPANMLDWAERVHSFAAVAGYVDGTGTAAHVAADGVPTIARIQMTTGNFFEVLGVRAALGRTLLPDETWSNGTRVAVASDRFWRERLGADPRIVGRTIQLAGRTVQIVGVMPRDFSFPGEGIDLWRPTSWDRNSRAQVFFRRAHWMRAIARLRPGVSVDRADAELQAVASRLEAEYPTTNKLMGAGLTPLHRFLVGDTRQALLVLLAAVAVLLLIACANVGNLLLVRAVGREREAALRLTLGAGRGRLVRQALVESLLLSALGGGAGLALGWAGTRALESLQPQGMLRVSHFPIDWQVVAYLIALVATSAVVFGAAPAVWAGHRSPAESLKGGVRTTDGARVRRWAELLVIGEVALALVLTLGAGLLVRSVRSLLRVHPGFEAEGVIAGTVGLPGARYETDAKAEQFFETLLQRLRTAPGVRAAAAVSYVSLAGRGYTSDFAIAGRPPGEYGSEVVHRTATPDYLAVMRVPLIAGRFFTDADRSDAAPVVVINEQLARAFFRGENPVGQRIVFDRIPDSTSRWSTIVGVIGNEHQRGLSLEPAIEAFTPFAQEPSSEMTIVARTDGPAAALGPVIRGVVRELDPNQPVEKLETLVSVRAGSLARDRFVMTLFALFAAVGLTLAVVGVYGVIAQLTRRRTREMGIRIALGAPQSRVRWLVVRHGLRLVSIGVAAGLIAALVATRGLASLLFHVAPVDPLTFAVVPVLLLLTGVVAAWLPARQAERADPVLALRDDG